MIYLANVLVYKKGSKKMKELNVKEMKNINASGLSAGAVAAIGAGIAFIIGVLDGYTRPFRCR